MATQILDCTLRDGGYVNNWEFKNGEIIDIVDSLIDCGVEVIECGFISHTKGKLMDSSLYKNIGIINALLKLTKDSSNRPSFACLINHGECDINAIPDCATGAKVITDIRLAFHKEDIDSAYNDCVLLIKKGYNVYAQPMVSLRYSDKELIALIERFNQINIHAIYIVDSFGSMSNSDFQRLYFLFSNNVSDKIKIGYHAHNNLQLAFSNAIIFAGFSQNNEILIDSSVFGMGRGAGNLNTELLTSFLNKSYSRNYKIAPLLEIIEKYLMSIHRESYWGFSPAHYLSAVNYCHPNYATYLINKKQFTIMEISDLLDSILPENKSNFDRQVIDNIIINYNLSKADDEEFKFPDFRPQKILVVASGNSVINEENRIQEFIKNNNPVVISMNHLPKTLEVDHVFFSNQLRFNQYSEEIDISKIIVTSNIVKKYLHKLPFTIDYDKLINRNNITSDNVTMLFINKLVNEGYTELFIAGLDGYSVDNENYSYQENYKNDDKNVLESLNNDISKSLSILEKRIKISLITTSIFK